MKRRPGALLLPVMLPLALGGCFLEQAIGPALVVGGASVVLTGRTPVDHVASLVTGQDCSVVRLERRESWCAPPPGPPAPQAYCTPSLGRVDCWTTPPPGVGRQVADPPSPLPLTMPAAPPVVPPVVPLVTPAAPPPVTVPVEMAPPAVAPAAPPPAPPPAAAPATPVARPAPVAPPSAPARRGEIRT